MKKIYLLLSLPFIMFSCGNDDSIQNVQNTNTINKVLLLKLNLHNYAFEGGKEFIFPESNTFTIDTDVDPLYVDGVDDTPLIGSSIIKYSELNEIIFDADIFEESAAQINLPQSFDLPGSYTAIAEAIPMPDLSTFENIPLDLYIVSPQVIETKYPLIWDAINNLELVKEYRESNPGSKVYVFQHGSAYEPAQALDTWKWYVILKN